MNEKPIAKTYVLGVDKAAGDDYGAEVDAVIEEDGRMVVLAVRRLPRVRPLIPVRPRNSAGVAIMARLMQRTRDERDFGGAVDDDA